MPLQGYANESNAYYKLYLFMNKAGQAGAAQDASFSFFLPESIGFQLVGEWDSPLAATIGNFANNGVTGAVFQGAQIATGHTPRLQSVTELVWQGSTGVDFNFQIDLRAQKSTKKEITDIMRGLAQLTLPAVHENAGNFIAPLSGGDFKWSLDGWLPQVEVQGRPQLDIQIGKFLLIRDVVVPSAGIEIPTRFHKSGKPIESTIQLTFRTRRTPSVQDVKDWFIGYDDGEE